MVKVIWNIAHDWDSKIIICPMTLYTPFVERGLVLIELTLQNLCE